MNIKKICAFMLSIAVLGGSSIAVYASQNSDASTKNVVVTATKTNEKHTGDISNEKAVLMASKAMKDYMGLDASFYSQTRVERNNHKDNTVTINVVFIPADGTNGSNFVSIDETTGKIINVTAINNLNPNSSGKVDDAKVKEASINFLKKIGKDADVDLNSIEIKNNNGALSGVFFQLKDQSQKIKGGARIGLEVSLQNYTVMHYDNDSFIYNR